MPLLWQKVCSKYNLISIILYCYVQLHIWYLSRDNQVSCEVILKADGNLHSLDLIKTFCSMQQSWVLMYLINI